MRIEDWNKAIKAFGRAVHLEPEDGQAWNNLASVYIRLKQKWGLNSYTSRMFKSLILIVIAR